MNTIVRHFIRNLSKFRDECQVEFNQADDAECKSLLNVDGSIEKQRTKLRDKVEKLTAVEKEIKKLKTMDLDH